MQTNEQKTTSHPLQTATVIASVADLETAEKIRFLAMHNLKRPWVFVMKSPTGYEVSVCNEFCGTVPQETIESIKALLVKEKCIKLHETETFTEEDGVLELVDEDIIEIH